LLIAAVLIAFSRMKRLLFCEHGDSRLDDWKTVYRSGAPLVCPSLPTLHKTKFIQRKLPLVSHLGGLTPRKAVTCCTAYVS